MSFINFNSSISIILIYVVARLLFALATPEAYMSGEFSDVGAALVGIEYGAAAWGDYDNDGDLDIVLTGLPGNIARIYRNTGGLFSDINASLTRVGGSSVAWGDYDNDGDLDLILAGQAGSIMTKVYRNDSGAFVDIGAAVIGVHYGSVAWGDFDNDGDLDILITGYTGSTPARVTSIYKNEHGTFADVNAQLPGVATGAAAWGDYDNDGDLDIVLVGQGGDALAVAKLFRNDSGMFTDSNAGLLGVILGDVTLGDYDNDGDVDILLTGLDGSNQFTTKLYRNNSGTFVDSGASIVGVSDSAAAWGDYDDDGDLDLVLAGNSVAGKIAKVYRNNAGTFSDIGAGLTGTRMSSVAWGDYDGDGDLDILLTGRANDSGLDVSKVYRNNATTANTAPSAPSNLSVSVIGSNVMMAWSPSADAQTPSLGLSYNLRIGTTPGGLNIASPMANLASGYRRLPALGNAQMETGAVLVNQVPGRYFWGVQAIDTALAGSLFSGEGSFTVITACALDLNLSGWVDVQDIMQFAARFNQPATWPYDLDGDNSVTAIDIGIAAGYWDGQCP